MTASAILVLAGVLRMEPLTAPVPAVARPFAGVVVDKVLVAGGSEFPDKSLVEGGKKSCRAEIWAFDPACSAWSLAGTLPQGRAEGASATTSRGVVCVGGATGADCAVVTNGAFLLTRSGVASLPPFPVAAKYMAAAASGDRVFAVGGDAVASIDLTAERPRWTEVKHLPMALTQPVCAVTKDALFVFGETEDDRSVGFCRSVSAVDDSGWVSVPPPSDGDRRFTGAVAATDREGRILVVGGTSRAPRRESAGKPRAWYLDHPDAWFRFPKTVLALDPSIRKWSVVGELPVAGRAGAAVAALPDGRLFVWGGEVGAGTRTNDGALSAGCAMTTVTSSR